MRKMKIACEFDVYDNSELGVADLRLVEAAQAATSSSYAPYSHFHVGAAVMLASGRIVQGSNQENAAYGICQCAERNALFAAACGCPDDAPVAIAIAARVQGGFLARPVTPCGACRQAMLETEERYGRQLRILLYGTEGTWACHGIGNLLPLRFAGDTMSETDE